MLFVERERRALAVRIAIGEAHPFFVQCAHQLAAAHGVAVGEVHDRLPGQRAGVARLELFLPGVAGRWPRLRWNTASRKGSSPLVEPCSSWRMGDAAAADGLVAALGGAQAVVGVFEVRLVRFGEEADVAKDFAGEIGAGEDGCLRRDAWRCTVRGRIRGRRSAGPSNCRDGIQVPGVQETPVAEDETAADDADARIALRGCWRRSSHWSCRISTSLFSRTTSLPGSIWRSAALLPRTKRGSVRCAGHAPSP